MCFGCVIGTFYCLDVNMAMHKVACWKVMQKRAVFEKESSGFIYGDVFQRLVLQNRELGVGINKSLKGNSKGCSWKEEL